MALPDTERRASGWRCSKTALQEDDAISLLKEFAELKRKERENDPKVKHVKNKYKLKASASPSPGNVLHTGRQLPRSPGPGVLALLPSQEFELREPGEKSFEQLRSFPVKEVDNMVPTGKKLPHSPLFTKPDHILREIQPSTKNVRGMQKRSQTVNNSDICNTTITISKTEADPREHQENEIPVSAQKEMTVPDTKRRSSGWRCSKTALQEEDAINLLKEFAELKRKERENDPKVKSVKKKYKLKASAYPSPGNILHTGRQLPRSPGPGVLPLLPSQIFEPQEPGVESLEQLRSFPVKEVDNRVPSGRQLPRTPLSTEPEQCHVLREVQPNANNPIHRLSQTGRCTTKISSNEEDINIPDLENKNPVSDVSAHKEATEKETNHQTRNIRRISELPVQGLNEIRISGVLKKLPGYECRSEDLEFLTYMKTHEKVKTLKEELLCLRKDLAATNQDKELIIARNDKIEEDIQRMKLAYEGTLRLGRAFLSRTQDAAAVQDLPPEDVLKQLNHLTVQSVHQQERAQLQTAQKEVVRRREEVASVTRRLEDTKGLLISKIESHKESANKAEERLQRLNDEVMTLKTQIEKTVKKKSELEASVQKMREQISQCLAQQSALPTQTEMSEEDRERMNRSLQRILHRKNLYLERERILQKLKRNLK